jgi:indolepyruvate ferredoxin oxidoreductase, beta subunit
MNSPLPTAAQLATKSTGVRPITIAILAMGGEGGGVLADWIVALGEHNAYYAQSTSVPGVAQRTGATIYYVELFPESEMARSGREPVLALMPVPGDVDVVLASELMEAGRAVQRGIVTPDRTTLIASTHRVYSISEKIAMGNGLVDSSALIEASAAAAKRFVRFDMAQTAEDCGSVVSAVLFGALAATGVLPFERAAFERTIERGGVGVKASLTAFEAGYGEAQADQTRTAAANPSSMESTKPRSPQAQALLRRIDEFPATLHAMLTEGTRRLVDYQDPPYADLYLDRLAAIHALEKPDQASGYRLTAETARHLALWMSYEDTIRVADLKTRATRFERVRKEVRAAPEQPLHINEFMHPRLQEVCDTLPVGLGRWLMNAGAARRVVARFAAKGRIVRTSSVRGFILLYVLAGLRRWRRATLRYHSENARIETWLARIATLAPDDYDLAVEVALCQRLVKGYSDTHERGVRNFESIMGVLDRLRVTGDAPGKVRALREAALADEQGVKLREVLEMHGFTS